MSSKKAASPKKIAKLVQSPEDKAVIVTLKKSEVGILSGVMGGCCSIIVLWDYDEDTKTYKGVRGHHAGGGPGNLNWGGLLADVPPGAGTLIIMSCAPNDYTGDFSYIGKVKRALKEDLPRNFQAKRKFLNYTNVYVTRNGKAKKIVDDSAFRDETKFKVRNMNKSPIF